MKDQAAFLLCFARVSVFPRIKSREQVLDKPTMHMYNICISQSKGEQIMAKKINLDMTSVENREMRLGTIIAWDGAASELVNESDYEGRKERQYNREAWRLLR